MMNTNFNERSGGMYSFSLENGFHKAFAVIEYSEEKALNALYEKEISFIKKLWERYYEDYTFSIEELKIARNNLMKYMDLELWENLSDKERKEQINLIYKLMAIVSYALAKDCTLYGSGD